MHFYIGKNIFFVYFVYFWQSKIIYFYGIPTIFSGALPFWAKLRYDINVLILSLRRKNYV